MVAVSVIIPVRDRLEMLLRAVQSVIDQSGIEFELIVVDDGSIIDLSSVREVVEAHNQIWLSVDRRGVSAARNIGVKRSSGEWLAFLDSDDYWLPEKLSQQMAFHALYPELQISQCEERWIRNGKRVNKKDIHQMPDGDAFQQSLALCCISPSSVIMKRELFDRCGPFDENLPVCEDYDLWLRITAKHKIGLLRKELVVKHGGHSDQLSKSEDAMDRYRLYSLQKLIQNGELSENQLELTKKEAIRRAEILKKGAKKHAPDKVSYYEELRAELEATLSP